MNADIAIGRMAARLAARGIVPSEHNLQLWEHADGSGWGAAINTPYPALDVEAHGATLQEALENLMRATNRGADIPSPSTQPEDVSK